MLNCRTRKKGIAAAILVAVLTTSLFVSIKVFAENNNGKRTAKPDITLIENKTKPSTPKVDTPITKNQEKVVSDNYHEALSEYIKNNPDKANTTIDDKIQILNDFMKANNLDHLTVYVNGPIRNKQWNFNGSSIINLQYLNYCHLVQIGFVGIT